MGPTPVYGARAEKPLQNADFAMKQTDICRLSGDINNNNPIYIAPYMLLIEQHLHVHSIKKCKAIAGVVI